MNTKIKLIYIAGPSRSGSTLIAEQLALHTPAIHLGEFRRISSFAMERDGRVHDERINGDCACGKAVLRCEFWTEIERKSGLDLKATEFDANCSKFSRLAFRMSALVLGPRMTKALCRVFPGFGKQLRAAENCWRLFDVIIAISGSDVLIDSSKQTHQFYMLQVARPDEIVLIGLFRNLRAVVSSAVKRPQKLQYVGQAGRELRRIGNASDVSLIKTAANSWRLVTLQQLGALFRTPSHCRFFLRYEDFCKRPSYYITQVIERFDLQLLEKQSVTCHAIGGSPSRYASGFKVIAAQESWKQTWCLDRERALSFSAKILNSQLGYR